MKPTYILTAVFATLVAGNPIANPDAEVVHAVPVETRQTRVTRVQLTRNDNDIGVQANIARNNQRISIPANFRQLGRDVRASRGNIVSAGGTCTIFAGNRRVAVLPANGEFVDFGGLVNLNNGVIQCR